MTQRKHEFEVAELIRKKVLHLITKDEEEQLNRWLTNEEIKAKYEELIQLKDLDSIQKRYETIDTDKAYQKLMTKIEGEKQAKTYYMATWVRYAAVLLLGGCLSLLVLKLSKKQDSMELAKTITPGYEHATLVLADGKEVTLMKDQNQLIDEDSSISNINNMLVYQSGDEEVLEEQLNTLYVPVGGIYSVTLGDGTKVWLNSKSSLKYPVVFSQNERRVWLEGEGYFEVSKNASKPFIVGTSSGDVTVLGTSFNISSYAEDNAFVTTLLEGSVKVSNFSSEQLKNHADVLLKPGDQARFRPGNDTQVLVKEVDAGIYSAWKNGKFYFENEPLESILIKMARWYDFELDFETESLKTIKFTGVASKEKSLDYLLEIIQETSNVNFEINKNEHRYEVQIVEN